MEVLSGSLAVWQSAPGSAVLGVRPSDVIDLPAASGVDWGCDGRPGPSSWESRGPGPAALLHVLLLFLLGPL